MKMMFTYKDKQIVNPAENYHVTKQSAIRLKIEEILAPIKNDIDIADTGHFDIDYNDEPIDKIKIKLEGFSPDNLIRSMYLLEKYFKNC